VKQSILVIEDNDINMDMMIFLLKALGYEVLPALNGPAGLSMAMALRPKLIICDIQMPQLDGYAVLHALKTDPEPAISTIPIIAVTAMAMRGDEADLMKAGFDGYLSKPVEFNDLKILLQRYLPR
jgi:CheY-like chemotaxis protein